MKIENKAGIIWMLIHSVVLTLMFAFGKFINQSLNVMQMLFIYHFIAFLFLLTFAFLTRFKKIKTRKIHTHFVRSFLSISGYAAYFYGLTSLPLDAATSITYLLPITVSYLGVIFFNERLTKARIFALILGFVGVILILKPGTDNFNISAAWIILSVVVWSGCDLVTKKLGSTENAFNQAFYSTFFGSLLIAPFGMYYWDNDIKVDEWFILTTIGILLVLQAITIFKSFQKADFSIVMPFDYFRLPLSTALGYIMFGEVMTTTTILGSILIISGGFYLIHHEHRKQYLKLPIS
jgi:drug/metabolite transporter (DMT)-like permease